MRDSSSHLVLTLADDLMELEASFRLVYNEYLKSGYILENPAGMHLTDWSLLPSSYVITAYCRQRLVGTLTCVLDSLVGLPLDCLIQDRLNEMRAQRRVLCELSAKASVAEQSANLLLFHMYRYALRLVRDILGATDFVIAVNPRHERYYTKTLLFEPIGELTTYSRMRGAPAMPLRLDLQLAPERYEQKYGCMRPERNLHYFFFVDGVEKQTVGIRTRLANRTGIYDSRVVASLFEKYVLASQADAVPVRNARQARTLSKLPLHGFSPV